MVREGCDMFQNMLYTKIDYMRLKNANEVHRIWWAHSFSHSIPLLLSQCVYVCAKVLLLVEEP